MSGQTEIWFDDDSGELCIEEFRTSDSDIAKYFADVNESERPERLETVLRVGVLALRSSETVQDVDYIEKRFQELQNLFNKQIEEHFGDDGKLVSDVFDPNDDDTPLGKLKNTIDTEIQKLRTDLDVAAREEELVESTTLKGDVFEENVYSILSEIASITGDRVEQTGDKQGLLGESKVGDFVVNLSEASASIVVEAKDMYYSQPKIEEEMEEAMENRGSSYGIFVARSIENVPDHVGWFNEYNQNQLVVVLSDGDDESYARELLKVGYRWAKMRVLEQEAITSEDFDATALQEEIAGAERTLGNFQTIKRKCASIEDAADQIRSEAEEIQDELEDELGAITEELSKAKSSTS